MNQKQIKHDLDRIANIDCELAAALTLVGYPPPRQRPQGFETFLSTLVGQQISTAAAGAILKRLQILLPTMSAENLLALPEKELREAGLSGRKVEYALGLAQAIVEGRLVPQALADLDDQQAIAAITEIRGFGIWSAEIYLMFSLRRRDIFPADDLALQVGLQRLKNLPLRPTASQARKLIEPWAPWRSAGSLFLWHYYRGAPT